MAADGAGGLVGSGATSGALASAALWTVDGGAYDAAETGGGAIAARGAAPHPTRATTQNMPLAATTDRARVVAGAHRIGHKLML